MTTTVRLDPASVATELLIRAAKEKTRGALYIGCAEPHESSAGFKISL